MTTKVNSRMIDTSEVSVKDFGAVGDGTTDDTAAIQLALDEGKQTIFPEGQYRITAKLSAPQRVLIGHGDCELIFEGAIDGIEFAAPTDHAKLAGAVGFEITKTTAHGTSLFITPRGAYNILRPMYVFDKLRIGSAYTASGSDGHAVDYSWAKMFLLGDSWLTSIMNVDAVGNYVILTNPASQTIDGFVKCDAVQGIMTLRMQNITTSHVADFCELEEKTYLNFDNIDVANARRGVFDSASRVFESNVYDYGECTMHNVVFNCQDYCVVLENRYDTNINNVTCHRAVGYNIGTEWFGVSLKTPKNCSVSEFRVGVNTTNTDASCGIQFDTSEDCRISGVSLGAITAGVRLKDSGGGACQGTSIRGVGLNNANVTTIIDLDEARSTTISNCEYPDSYTVTNEILYGNTATKVSTTISNVFGYSHSLGRYDEFQLDGSHGYRVYIDTASGSIRRALVDSSFGSTTNFELVTRTGTTIDGIEWRGSLLHLNCSSGGNVRIGNMPTSASGLSAGDVYSDSGTLKIV